MFVVLSIILFPYKRTVEVGRMSGLHKGKPKNRSKNFGGQKSRRRKQGHKGKRAYFREPRSWQKKKNPKRLRIANVPAIPPQKTPAPKMERVTPIGLCVLCGKIQEGFGNPWVEDHGNRVAARLEAANLRFNFAYCLDCTPSMSLKRGASDLLRIIARQAKLMRQYGHLTIAEVKGMV